MEVHHHPHLASGEKKKNFKEYFLEFLMIFLAVTMGFFAESFRENIVENKKLHGYMEQMVENLKFDTTRCGNALRFNKGVSSYLDSFRYEIDQAANGNIHSNKLYYFDIQTQPYSYVLFKQAAITQLKNSGNLRLIENKKLFNQILEYYDRWVVGIMNQSEIVSNCRKAFTDNCSGFFYWQFLDKLNTRDTVFSYAKDTAQNNYIDSVLMRNPPLKLLNINSGDLRKLNNQACQFEQSLHQNNSYMKLANNLATALIPQIQKEYDLENE
jgi:hypothetical protein